MEERTGVIIRATGGFYTVDTPAGTVECRARGLFRKDNLTPYVGDVAFVQMNEEGTGTVIRIGNRKNHLIRPPVANLDQLILVLSTTDPAPNMLITDKLICVAEHKGILPVIVVTKTDLSAGEDLSRLYRQAGFPVFTVDNTTGNGAGEVRDVLAGKLSAFAGNSGVGKSSLLNQIDPLLNAETGETSKKLGRGRHTTRHVEIFKLKNGGMIADTPGFSSIDPSRMDQIEVQELAYCFREFAPYLGRCRFADCSHTVEKGCAILEAILQGDIDPSRHASYAAMVEEAKNNRPY